MPDSAAVRALYVLTGATFGYAAAALTITGEARVMLLGSGVIALVVAVVQGRRLRDVPTASDDPVGEAA